MKIVGTLIAAASLVVCLAGGLASPATVPDLSEHLATRLIGKTIENQDALQLGKLKDFIIEADTGKPLYAVVSSGGLAGLKPRRSLVPAPALSLATAKRSVLYVEVPSKKWQEAPVFKKSELSNSVSVMSFTKFMASMASVTRRQRMHPQNLALRA